MENKLTEEYNKACIYTERDSGDIAMEFIQKLIVYTEELEQRIEKLENKNKRYRMGPL